MSYAEAWPQLWGKHDLLKRYWPPPPGLPEGPVALDNVFLHIPRSFHVCTAYSVQQGAQGKENGLGYQLSYSKDNTCPPAYAV